MNNAAMIFTYKSLYGHVFISLWKIFRNETVGSFGKIFQNCCAIFHSY